MVITVEIDKLAITKVFVDQGSSVNILYWKTFKKMRIPKSEIQPYDDEIVGFSGERVDTREYIDLYTTFGKGKYSTETLGSDIFLPMPILPTTFCLGDRP